MWKINDLKMCFYVLNHENILNVIFNKKVSYYIVQCRNLKSSA